MIKRAKKIQRLVENMLQEENITEAPINVKAIAIRRGISVLEDDLGEISGWILKEGNLITIGVNNKHAETRKRFTIAHELGHLFLHSDDPFHVDKVFGVKLRDHKSSEAVDVEEIESNAFAAELLMPTNMIRSSIGDFQQILDYEKEDFIATLAGKYKVSQQAMTIRLINLGFIDSSS
jgi:Zn-dependent peptidase ImmA (M78 family)